MDRDQNDLLASLFANVKQAEFEPHFRTVELKQGQVLAEWLGPIRHVYFPYSGIVSFLIPLQDGAMVQTGVVGRDGVVGAFPALHDKISANRIVVQVPGRAAVIDAYRLAEFAQGHANVRSLLSRHEQFFLCEAQQSAACNAVHTIHQRICRWLLRANDLAGMHVPMTQELLAEIIGVRRTSVSLAAASLQSAGVIKYTRGHIQIVDIDRLRHSSCECYQTVRDHYQRNLRSSADTRHGAGK
jgi:CRP-like cAMP-binding protein